MGTKSGNPVVQAGWVVINGIVYGVRSVGNFLGRLRWG